MIGVTSIFEQISDSIFEFIHEMNDISNREINCQKYAKSIFLSLYEEWEYILNNIRKHCIETCSVFENDIGSLLDNDEFDNIHPNVLNTYHMVIHKFYEITNMVSNFVQILKFQPYSIQYLNKLIDVFYIALNTFWKTRKDLESYSLNFHD